MNLAHSTHRTLILPPLLPHVRSHTTFKFGGRGGKSFAESINIAINFDAKTSSSVNSTEFPSWSEVLEYDLVTQKTGVHLVDLWEFMQTSEFHLVGALLNHTVDTDGLAMGDNWMEFEDEFNKHYENHTVAVIGSAFGLGGDEAFARYNEGVAERIRRATLTFTPSNKLLGLIRSAIIHIPRHYVGVHIRFGDMYHLTDCNEPSAKAEYTKLISRIREANVTHDTAIYLGSKDGNAKRCFDEHSGNEYRVFTLNDVMDAASTNNTEEFERYNLSGVIPRLSDAMNGIHLDDGTKYLLIDMILVSLGQSFFFSRVSFRPNSSTFQSIIEQRHEYREEFLNQILNADTDHRYL